MEVKKDIEWILNKGKILIQVIASFLFKNGMLSGKNIHYKIEKFLMRAFKISK